MARQRRPRLSWFRFFPGDFLEGAIRLPTRGVGQYLLLLLAQWASKEAGGVPNEPEVLRAILRGDEPMPDVLSKFDPVGQVLRNARLWDEWQAARDEYSKMAGPPPGPPPAAPPATPPVSGGGPVRVPPPAREPQPQPQPETDTATSSTALPDLVCPACHTGALVRERYPRGLIAGWVCWKQRKGCGALYAVNDPAILSQLTRAQREALKLSILRESKMRDGNGDTTTPAPPRASSDPAVPAAWEEIRERLRRKMTPEAWKLWIETLVPLRFEEEGACIVILSPHPAHAQWLMENHGKTVAAAVEASGLAAFKVEFPDSPPPKGRGLPL